MATWIGITLIAWVVLSVAVSFLVGGMIRIADTRRLASPLDADKVRPLRKAAARPDSLRRVS